MQDAVVTGEPRAQGRLEQATGRVEEIIDRAEQAAEEILGAAEAEAERYVREVSRESEREAVEHAEALSQLSESLVSQAEALSRQSSLILQRLNEPAVPETTEPGNRDVALSEWPAAAGGRQLGVEDPLQAAPYEEALDPSPFESPTFSAPPEPFTGIREESSPAAAAGAENGPIAEAEIESAPVEESAEASAPDAEATEERAPAGGEPVTERYSAGARLLATQMAVAGSDRAEIRRRLVGDFEIGDPDPLLDAIIGRA